MNTKAVFAALIVALAAPASAATFDDPTWPCLQRKVETLSLGIMWPHPVSEAAMREDLVEDGRQLAETLALRRVDLTQGETFIDAFVTRHDALSTDDLGHVFRDVFNLISSDRTALIKGIGRYSLQQKALAASIDDIQLQMTSLMEAEAPDFDKVDSLEEKLDWDRRIFRDRAQSLTYVCETPVLLEKRIYAIAQILLKYVPE